MSPGRRSLTHVRGARAAARLEAGGVVLVSLSGEGCWCGGAGEGSGSGRTASAAKATGRCTWAIPGAKVLFLCGSTEP